MISNLYAIYDEKVEVFNSPVRFSKDGEAHRGFIDLSQDKNTLIGKHQRDFKLYRIATFNDNTGEIKAITPPILVAEGQERKNNLPNTQKPGKL